MPRLRALVFLVLPLALSCGIPARDAAVRIIEKPIRFSRTRIDATRSYLKDHYGIDGPDIEMVPRMIVVHWTAAPTLEASWRIFDSETLAGSRPDLAGSGAVNVSVHFLVDRDGAVYRLMPETWTGRHVIGLNHCAIGIENVGGAGGADDLTEAQLEANARLVGDRFIFALWEKAQSLSLRPAPSH